MLRLNKRGNPFETVERFAPDLSPFFSLGVVETENVKGRLSETKMLFKGGLMISKKNATWGGTNAVSLAASFKQLTALDHAHGWRQRLGIQILGLLIRQKRFNRLPSG